MPRNKGPPHIPDSQLSASANSEERISKLLLRLAQLERHLETVQSSDLPKAEKISQEDGIFETLVDIVSPALNLIPAVGPVLAAVAPVLLKTVKKVGVAVYNHNSSRS